VVGDAALLLTRVNQTKGGAEMRRPSVFKAVSRSEEDQGREWGCPWRDREGPGRMIVG
jgi:hypothetical protein